MGRTKAVRAVSRKMEQQESSIALFEFGPRNKGIHIIDIDCEFRF
jgi:hypothetical protein